MLPTLPHFCRYCGIFDRGLLVWPSLIRRLRMRIAQIPPLHEAVPPRLYGGTERVVSYLTEELVALGHDVTLFASGDSITSARLEAIWPRALRFETDLRDPFAAQMLLLETVCQ